MGKQFIERSPVIIGVITAVLILITLWASLTISREDLTGGYAALQRFSARDSFSEELCKFEPLHGVC